MTSRPRLLFYCQHSVGMGHLMRSLALVHALDDAFDVTLVTGGAIPRGVRLPVPVNWVSLPPVGMDPDGKLVSRDGRRRLDRVLRARQRKLLATYREQKPHVVVVELFPFGRRKFLPELEPALAAARDGSHRARVFCSLRDILVSRNPEHDAHAAGLLNRYFDGVLVHSDPSFARLEDGFSGAIAAHVAVRYTGFVHATLVPRQRPSLRRGSIVVSAGGGIVGEPLLQCAIEAHASLPMDLRPRLTLLAGPFLPDAAWRRLQSETLGHDGIVLRRSVRNLANELRHAAGSISQCGYNTAMDLIASGVPALVVPFGEGSEDEQLKRARKLEALGLVRVLLPSELTPSALGRELADLPRFRPARAGLSMNGAASTAKILVEMLGDRAAPPHADERRSVA